MDLDERATKVEVKRWNKDRTSFTCVCPGCSGTLAVSLARTKCLDGCDITEAWFANGAGVAQTAEREPSKLDVAGSTPVARSNGNGHVHDPESVADLTSWRLKVHTLAKELLDTPNSDKLTPQAREDGLLASLRRAVESESWLILPLPELSATDIDEELQGIVRVCTETARQALVPAKADERLDLLTLTRTTVEVFSWSEMATRRAANRRDWVVEGLLARRETSSWSGKVEAGKTTLMRELTMSVIRGEPFLGRNTIKGRVFYAMLDADGEDVTYDEFAKLGFTAEDEPWCRFMFEPMLASIENGLAQFIRILTEFEPSLVIIDPYPRLKIIEDFHSYTNTYLMGMLSEIAKIADANLALPGHIPRGRGDDDDVATAGFGSISFSGGVNARFVVTNRNGIHTIRSSKGKAAGFQPFEAEMVLNMDAGTGRVSMGDPFSWKDKGRAAADPAAAFLAAHSDRPFDLISLAREMKQQKSVLRTALGNLFHEGRIQRGGEGLKRNPFIYASLTYPGALTIEEVRRE